MQVSAAAPDQDDVVIIGRARPTVFASSGSPSEINKHVLTQLTEASFAPGQGVTECQLRCHAPRCSSTKRWRFYAHRVGAARTEKQTRANEIAKKDLLRHLAKDHVELQLVASSRKRRLTPAVDALQEQPSAKRGLITKLEATKPSPAAPIIIDNVRVDDVGHHAHLVVGHMEVASEADTTESESEPDAAESASDSHSEDAELDGDGEAAPKFVDAYICPVDFVRKMAQDQKSADRMLAAPRAVIKQGKLYHRLPLDLAERTAKDPRILSPFPIFSTIADVVAGFKALQARQIIVKPGETTLWWEGRGDDKFQYEQLWSGPLCGAEQFTRDGVDKVLVDHVASYLDNGRFYRLLPAMSSDRPNWQEWAEAVKLVRQHTRSLRDAVDQHLSKSS